MQPINYMIQGADPSRAAFEGVGFGQGIRQTEQVMRLADAEEARKAEMHPLNMAAKQQAIANSGASAARAEASFQNQAQAQQRQQAFQIAMGQIATKGADATLADFNAVVEQFPEYGVSVMEAWDGVDADRKAGMSRRLGMVAAAIKSGNTDLARTLGEEYADAAEASQEPALAATARSMVAALDSDPNAALATLGTVASILDLPWASNVFEAGDAARVQSSNIISGRVAVQQMSDGEVRVVDTATNQVLTGEDARAALQQAEQAGIDFQGARAGARTEETLVARKESGGQAKAAEGLGALQADFVKEAFKARGSVSSTLTNIDRAIAAIDAGARSGVFDDLLPNLSQASAELKNARDSLGLDVIGSVTFGALSEGEMRLAMDVATPPLNEHELRSWLVARKDAQEKVIAALNEQAMFLSDPDNTLQDWAERVAAVDAPEAGQDMPSPAEMTQRGFPSDTTPEEYQRILQIGAKAAGARSADDIEFLRGLMRRAGGQ